MSDPGQLVELFSPAHALEPESEAAVANEANPFVAQPAAVTGASTVASGVSPGNGDSSRSPAGAPAPSAIELQSLLLAVATAEGVSELKAMGRRGGGNRGDDGGDEDKKEAGGSIEDQVVAGRVGVAAVEMLGRLTNQLLSG